MNAADIIAIIDHQLIWMHDPILLTREQAEAVKTLLTNAELERANLKCIDRAVATVHKMIQDMKAPLT